MKWVRAADYSISLLTLQVKHYIIYHWIFLKVWLGHWHLASILSFSLGRLKIRVFVIDNCDTIKMKLRTLRFHFSAFYLLYNSFELHLWWQNMAQKKYKINTEWIEIIARKSGKNKCLSLWPKDYLEIALHFFSNNI